MCWTLAFLLLLLGFTQSYSIKTFLKESSDETDNSIEKEHFSISALIERANKNVGQNPEEPLIRFGDVATYAGFQNADPCTDRGCTWPRSRDRNTYVPYIISNQYSSRERDVIENALRSFHKNTCIRFVQRRREQDFIHIRSETGCYSFIGRRGGEQVISVNRRGCVYHGVVQHEVLHALGFNHEHTRSDRNLHVQILFQNIIPGQEYNFRHIQTNNLGTPYDYNSVMHYGRYAFSKNRQPTIIPIPDRNAAIGRATEMSNVDILRVNKLYCK